uniref:A kinase-anchoring proteins AKAP-5 and AKAP-12 calmodulin (CaM)-binding domain-containing protein n=1 Tax=Naja naja TaxID=35670 RepID=A0A8C6X0E0_NAJNA
MLCNELINCYGTSKFLSSIFFTVGETKAANLILEEESPENIKTSPPELNDKSNEDEIQKDPEDANKQLESEEKEDQLSVSPSNDVGFKKVFKLVGFKFTVKKDKTEKVEPVQLLDVKPEVAEESSDVAEDYKQFKTETVAEATQSEITASVDKTEEETQVEEMERETSSEKVTESPVEAESKEAEIKNNGIKSPESPVSPSTAETASPLRKFFTQSWAGFRKRTSFRKSKEEVQSEKEKQEQEMEKEVTEAATPSEQPSAEEPAENINKDISFEPEEPFEIIEKSEPRAPLATEIFDEKPREINIDVGAVVTEEEPQITKKEQLVLEQLVETNDDFQKEQPTVEQLKVTETVLEIAKEHFIQTDPSSLDAAVGKLPEGIITSEAELLSSQEKAKMQGSPLKKLFTGPGLKKLSRKKRKGKKAKPEEAAEEAQQLSDTAESPDDPRGESSASSPEEITESIEKAPDAAQIPEAEEGFPLDAEKKRESVTPWASFKKMVTPKKRVRRLSEGDREEELDKTTESGPNDEQEDIKENVDTSVSWEALICVGSSKRRSRKSSSSDEEAGQRLAQDEQKLDESAPNKEAVHDTIFTNSHESDQGQGSSSPEQAGSPSETEGISTWESFKRLVTPRRKSKTRMEEKNDEPITVPSLEHATLDGDTGKEESWVSFKKLMPGRRKKKSDGIPEHAPVLEAGEEMTGTNEEDFDVPAVVPLSEYDAAEQEKFEAQKSEQDDMDKEIPSQNIEKSESTSVTQQVIEGLVHAVAVSVLEGERAIISIEERSPSWIPAAVTVSTEHVNDDEEQSEQISGTGIVEETVVVTKLGPQMRKDISGDSIIGDLELTSEAVTAREEASIIEETTEVSCAKETTEMSCAEETTEMISAVSRLTESPDTTEIATPVQEIEENEQDLEELNKQTQEMLQIVAERIKLSDEKGISASLTEVTIQPLSAKEETEHKLMTSEGIPSTEFPKDVQHETVESRVYEISIVLSKQKSEIQKVITSEGISSTEFPKDVQSETIESQSLKSAQKASTVVQFQQEPMALSKQKSETAVLYPDEVAFSEKIDSVLEESPEKCTRDTALQMSTS